MAGIRGLKQLREREVARVWPTLAPERVEVEPVTVYVPKADYDAVTGTDGEDGKPYLFGKVGVLLTDGKLVGHWLSTDAT